MKTIAVPRSNTGSSGSADHRQTAPNRHAEKPSFPLVGPYDPNCGEYTFLAPPLGVRQSGPTVEGVSEVLAHGVALIAAKAPNEESLKHEVENRLEAACKELGITWTPYQLNRTLVDPNSGSHRFADVAHGALVIEYEPPRSFKGKLNAVLRHARDQATEYATLLSREEGRAIEQYVLVAWDGDHITFGAIQGGKDVWEPVRAFNADAARRLLQHLALDGAPLVSPRLLAAYFGPEQDTHGSRLVPLFFGAIVGATVRGDTKTRLLFNEWNRLFGQASGVQSDRLKEFLVEQGRQHGADYARHPSQYLFALNTYIALVAKLVAAYSLPGAGEDLRDGSISVTDRIRQLETGALFQSSGISNLLVGDFFSWYRDDAAWSQIEPIVGALMEDLALVNFDPAKRNREAIRDLFKQMYEAFVPRDMRHALGEYYTPDWLAAFVLDRLEWDPINSLLDPTCGSGTFLLEAIKRRRASRQFANADAAQLLAGLYGTDLNPLASLTARASIVTFISDVVKPAQPIRIPVYLADAINSAEAKEGIFAHNIQTDKGTFTFLLPDRFVRNNEFYEVMEAASAAVNEGLDGKAILRRLHDWTAISSLSRDETQIVETTFQAFADLHRQRWDGIWCLILAERFTAGSIGRVHTIAGNPPWVKWSHLPPEYAAFIKPQCERLGVFSDDAWVGGIESDISTVVTYEAIRKWLRPDGRLGFLITGTVFKNESSQGFRRFALPDENLRCTVLHADDFSEIRPFEGTTNHPVLFVVQRDTDLKYPVPYTVWHTDTRMRTFADAAAFCDTARAELLFARPVPGSDAGPWLVGSAQDHKIWDRVFNQRTQHYQARKGVTTDLNGVFFVRVSDTDTASHTVRVENDPSLGRIKVPKVTRVIEDQHLFPLLRGKDVDVFSAKTEPRRAILVPQRGMHGEADLGTTHPRTYQFLMRFADSLRARSSYRRFQKRQAIWSLWSTGPYTFSPFKVVWKEMAGGNFCAT